MNTNISQTSSHLFINKLITAQFIVNKIKNGDTFSMSRFGDKECVWALGLDSTNCDGHDYFPEMGEELKNIILSNPEYFLATTVDGIENNRKYIQCFIRNSMTNRGFVDAHLFQFDSVHSNVCNVPFSLLDLFKQLDNIVVVGPKRLRYLKDKTFQYFEFVELPDKNCYLAKNKVMDEILAICKKYEGKSLVFSICAGPLANILVDTLYNVLGKKHSFLDLGSLWDPYVGYETRKYQRPLLRKIHSTWVNLRKR